MDHVSRCNCHTTRALVVLALAILLPTASGCSGPEPSAKQHAEFAPTPKPQPQAASEPGADLLLLNANVLTQEPDAPMAEAVAVTDGKIVYVGAKDGADKLKGAKTEVIDLAGKTVLPGFVSAHDHIVASRWMSRGVDLNPAKNREDLFRILKEYLAAHPEAERIRGMGWSQANAGGLPTAKDLDAVIPDKPAILIDYTGHEAWLNTKALELGGIDKDSPDLKPGTTYWVRDKRGNPTGVAIEGQWMPTFVKTGFWEPEEMIEASATELFAVATKNGTTTALVPGFVTPTVVMAKESMDDYEKLMGMLKQAEVAGELPLRLVTLPWFKSPKLDPEELAEFAKRMQRIYHSDMLRTGGVKIHPETNWTSWGAPMVKRYSNKNTMGEFGVTPERIKAMVLAANKRGLDVFSHADGSATVRAIINAIEAAREAGIKNERNAIHHLLWLDPDDYQRIVDMKIPINVTPAFSNDWSGQDKLMYEFLGKKRVETEASRYADLARDGVCVSISADVPSTTPAMQGPLYVIESAVTFQDPQDPNSKPFPPNREPMSVDQAITAMTTNPAWQLRMEDKIGSIKVGKLADLVVLEKDPHDVPPRDIADIKVLATILSGKFTHRKGI